MTDVAIPRQMNPAPIFRWAAVAAITGVSVAAPIVAVAAEPIAASAQQPLRDPWVPPEARNPSRTPPPAGAALRAEVERKLRQAFDDADLARSGSLTREQARAAGLGYVVRHFDAIDRQRRGAVQFDDVKRFMVERGARLD
jgi:hypothetical protein